VQYSLLLVENEALDAESLYQPLTDNGHTIILAHSSQAAREAIATRWPDLVIFNRLEGDLALCEATQVIAETELDIPRLALVAAPPADELAIEALLHLPYSRQQLIGEMDRLVQPTRFLRWGDITLDTHKKALLRDGVAHHLTPKLLELLMFLAANKGKIVYRKTIMKEVWETDYMGDTRTLDVHIRWLREKIEDNPSRPRRLLTVRGAGYRFFTYP